MDLFWCKGYEAASMDGLTQAMGIGRGSLYDTYRNKHELFLEALRLARRRNGLDPARLLDDGCSPRQAIERVFAVVIDEAVDDPRRRGCMIVNAIVELAAHDPAVAAEGRAAIEQTEAGLAWLVEQGQRRGELSGDLDPDSVACFLANSLNGLRVTGKVRPDRTTLEAISAHALSVLR